MIVGESNNAGVSGPPKANGGWGAKPPTLRQFFTFFFKKYSFLSLLWSKFLLKTRFYMLAKSVLVGPQGLRPRVRAPTFPLLRHC